VIVNIDLALAHAGSPEALSCRSDLSPSEVADFRNDINSGHLATNTRSTVQKGLTTFQTIGGLARQRNTYDHVCEVIDAPRFSDSNADDCFRREAVAESGFAQGQLSADFGRSTKRV
jgi:hypothetical protein